MLDSTAYLLVVLHRSHRAALVRRLAALDIHPGAEVALAELWRAGAMSHSTLAARLGVSKPNVTKLVRGLERAGLVERASDPEDGRVSVIDVTRAGAALRGAVEEAWEAAERDALARLTDVQRRTLHHLLRRAASQPS